MLEFKTLLESLTTADLEQTGADMLTALFIYSFSVVDIQKYQYLPFHSILIY